jgi:hypothetical protein
MIVPAITAINLRFLVISQPAMELMTVHQGSTMLPFGAAPTSSHPKLLKDIACNGKRFETNIWQGEITYKSRLKSSK